MQSKKVEQMDSEPIFRKSEWAGGLIREANLGGYSPSSLITEGKLKPDFSCIEGDFGIVIAYKKSTARQIRFNRSKISMTDVNTAGYAVNKACKCAEDILKSTSGSTIREIFAIGMSGDKDNHIITPVLVRRDNIRDEEGNVEPRITMKILDNVKSLQEFSRDNIRDYRRKEYRRGFENDEGELRDLATRFGKEIQHCTPFTQNEALIAGSGMILAQMWRDERGDKAKQDPDWLLHGESEDGKKLVKWMKSALNLKGKEKFIYHFFDILQAPVLHERSSALNEQTPAQHLMKFLDQQVSPFENRKEGALPIFFNAFKRYLEIHSYLASIPDFVTSLFYDVLAIKPTDHVLNTYCGTGELMSSIAKRMKEESKGKLGEVYGIENPISLQMAAPAAATFKINEVEKCHILEKASEIKANIGLLCPSYEAIRDNSFDNLMAVNALLSQIEAGGKALCVVPQSALSSKNGEDVKLKREILDNNTLEGVITLKRRIGIFPCIAVFTAGIPHPKDKECKFVNYSITAPYYRLTSGPGQNPSDEEREAIINLWRNGKKGDSKEFVKAKVGPKDEWLHSFFYFNSEIPSKEDFEKTVGDYLSFEFSMIMQGREYLFDN